MEIHIYIYKNIHGWFHYMDPTLTNVSPRLWTALFAGAIGIRVIPVSPCGSPENETGH